MNRQIKFRGLRTDGKGWAFGSLAYFFDNPKNAMIMPSCYYGTKDFGQENEDGSPVIEDELALGGFVTVNPETVGQFTGLKDKNGVKIFEGDIVKISNLLNVVAYSEKYGGFTLNKVETGQIIVYNIDSKVIEVRGNIHEQ